MRSLELSDELRMVLPEKLEASGDEGRAICPSSFIGLFRSQRSFNLKIDPSFPRLASTMTSLFPGLYSSMTAPYPSRASLAPLCEHVLSRNVSVVTPFAKKERSWNWVKIPQYDRALPTTTLCYYYATAAASGLRFKNRKNLKKFKLPTFQVAHAIASVTGPRSPRLLP